MILFIFTSLFLQNNLLAFPQSSSIKIEKVESQKIYFTNTVAAETSIPPLETTLFNIEPITLIPLKKENNENFFVFLKALPCEGCDLQKNLYLISSNGKNFTKFTYPGSIKDTKTNLTVHNSRAYYGECIQDGEWTFVTFQDDRSPKRRMKNSVFIANLDLATGNIKEELIVSRKSRPQESNIKSRVKKGNCHTINAWNRTTIPFQLRSK